MRCEVTLAVRCVRLAASLAIDRQALGQAETLGLSHTPTGSIVPRDFEFALPFDPHRLGFPTGLGPSGDDILATGILGFYMSPYEDLKLKRP